MHVYEYISIAYISWYLIALVSVVYIASRIGEGRRVIDSDWSITAPPSILFIIHAMFLHILYFMNQAGILPRPSSINHPSPVISHSSRLPELQVTAASQSGPGLAENVHTMKFPLADGSTQKSIRASRKAQFWPQDITTRHKMIQDACTCSPPFNWRKNSTFCISADRSVEDPTRRPACWKILALLVGRASSP